MRANNYTGATNTIMTLLPILTYPNPTLKEKCLDVTTFDAELSKTLDNMLETMYDANGVGLAGSQVGILKRITVIDISEAENEKLELVNPTIIEQTGKTSSEEGCLSIPEYQAVVTRSDKIKVQAYDRNGKEFELDADELLAICIQHEIDHLDGILFVDRLSRLKREMFKQWLKKRGPFE